jgi:hypothetical protein
MSLKLKDIIQELIAEHDPNFISGGLIRSYPLKQVENILNNRFHNDAYGIKSKESREKIISTFLHIRNNIKLTTKDLEYFVYSLDVIGYYPTTYQLRDLTKLPIKFDIEDVNKILNTDLFQITSAPKFQLPEKPENLPSHMYHVTLASLEDKILKKGFVPKTNNKFEKHPTRVYFAIDMEGIEILLKDRRFTKDDNNEYVIFKLDIIKLLKHPHNDSIHFYKDGSFKNKAYYTMDNISPEYIEVIKRNVKL